MHQQVYNNFHGVRNVCYYRQCWIRKKFVLVAFAELMILLSCATELISDLMGREQAYMIEKEMGFCCLERFSRFCVFSPHIQFKIILCVAS